MIPIEDLTGVTLAIEDTDEDAEGDEDAEDDEGFFSFLAFKQSLPSYFPPKSRLKTYKISSLR